MGLSGLYNIDGIDLWDNYGISVESGTDLFLQFPEVKDRLSEDWEDENGIDIDLDSPTYVKSRDITINFFILTDKEEDFWSKWLDFRSLLFSKGLHLFYIDRFKRSFGIVYKSASDINVTNKRFDNGGKIKFSITFTELNPAYVNEYMRLITDKNNNLITDKLNYVQVVKTKTNF